MDKTEIDIKKFETHHSKNGYNLITTAEVFIPWFKCTVKCKCEEEHPMSELDKIFCMCIQKGINNINDISFVLSLKSDIVIGECEILSKGKIISCEKDVFSITDYGNDCFARKIRLNSETKEYPIYINAITGDYFISEDTDMFISKINSEGIKLSPIRTIVQKDIAKNKNLYNDLEKYYNTNILDAHLLDFIETEYTKEHILFYQNNEKQVLFEIFDDLKDEIDIKLSAALRKKYEKREILELIKAEQHLEIANTAFLKYIEENSKINSNTQLSSTTLKYLRNQEIRELFLKELTEAKQHIFIISPWINDFVVDEEMIERFENALKRGIEIEIGFGYSSLQKIKYKLNNGKTVQSDKDIASWEKAKELNSLFKKYKNFNISYVREGTHEKVFCFDEESIFIGSFNLLSYDGGEQENYSGFRFRYEGGVLIENKEFAGEIMSNFKASFEKM